MTYLIEDVAADELTDRHEPLGPFLVGVPGAHFHRDSAAASNFLYIRQAVRKHTHHFITIARTCRALCSARWTLVSSQHHHLRWKLPPPLH